MRILLLTLSAALPETVGNILNPQNNYCAVVVDEVEPARNFLSKFNYPAERIFPLYELPECVENFFYDCVVCIGDSEQKLVDEAKRCGVPRNKIVHLMALNSGHNFLFDRALRYFEKNFAEFKIFATGMSYTEVGLIAKNFSKKLFNFGRASQDLYFDFEIAKKILSRGGLKIALIGLAPYSFHYDESKTYKENFWLTEYAITLNDLHNFWLPVEKYRSLFRKEYLELKLPIDDIEIDSVSVLGDYPLQKMNVRDHVDSRKRIDVWKDRNFPETKAENLKIFDDLLTLCEEKSVTPIIFLPPMTEGYKKYFSRQKLNEFYCAVEDALQKHKSAKFFDGWQLQGFSDADFLNTDHLNLNGAKKFSAALNNFVEQL